MSNTIQYLNERSLEELANNNIKVAHVPNKNAWILNYEQVPTNPNGFGKKHPVLRECRNLVVRDNPWRVLSQSFVRFYNWGEDVEETNNMKEKMLEGKVVAREKFDGSLITVVYFDDQWNIFTRGSDADLNPFRGLSVFGSAEEKDTFGSRVRKYVDFNKLDKEITYVFELCTPGMHVTKYNEEFVALLSANKNGVEVEVELDLDIKYPEVFRPTCIEDVLESVKSKPIDYEGYVLSYTEDSVVKRIKYKSETYVSLHHIGSKQHTIEDLISIVINGEVDEVSVTIPHLADELKHIYEIYERHVEALDEFCERNRDLEKKEFAVKAQKISMSWVLFDAYNKKERVRNILQDRKNMSKIINTVKKMLLDKK